jgi:hypothetical protein
MISRDVDSSAVSMKQDHGLELVARHAEEDRVGGNELREDR